MRDQLAHSVEIVAVARRSEVDESDQLVKHGLSELMVSRVDIHVDLVPNARVVKALTKLVRRQRGSTAEAEAHRLDEKLLLVGLVLALPGAECLATILAPEGIDPMLWRGDPSGGTARVVPAPEGRPAQLALASLDAIPVALLIARPLLGW